MYSEILILAILRQGPRHGYEIKKEIDRAFGGMVTLNNKTLYLALKRFEEMGAVTRQVIPQEGKPNRHLYQLTEIGIELLHAHLCDFGPEQAASDAEFFTRVSFFNLLEAHEREEILTRRLGYLEACLEYLHKLQHVADSEDCAPGTGSSMSYAQRVLAFHVRRVRDEYQWIATWLEEMKATR
ncbi:MAG TPA: PadR family transcriptional regulator [Ktedonobacteraceae bacterium]